MRYALHAASPIAHFRESFKVDLRIGVGAALALLAASAIIVAPWNGLSSSLGTKPAPTAPSALGPVSPAATRARRPPRSSRRPPASKASTPSGASTRGCHRDRRGGFARRRAHHRD